MKRSLTSLLLVSLLTLTSSAFAIEDDAFAGLNTRDCGASMAAPAISSDSSGGQAQNCYSYRRLGGWRNNWCGTSSYYYPRYNSSYSYYYPNNYSYYYPNYGYSYYYPSSYYYYPYSYSYYSYPSYSYGCY